MAYTFSEAQAKSPHAVQYTEFIGNCGIYEDGWYAMTLHKAPWELQARAASFDQDEWELYNTTEDFSCAIDLASVPRQAEGNACHLPGRGGQV